MNGMLRSFFFIVHLCFLNSLIVFGQADVRFGTTATFRLQATGQFDVNLVKTAIYASEEPSTGVILTPGFWSKPEPRLTVRKEIDDANQSYRRAFGEYYFHRNKESLADVSQKCTRLEELINKNVPESTILRGQQVASARTLLLRCLDRSDPLFAGINNEKFDFLKSELARIEKQAYQQLLEHCTPKQKEAFDLFVQSYHYASLPLPSFMHSQLLEKHGFQGVPSSKHTVGWELTPCCSIGPSSAGGMVQSELMVYDILYLLGTTTIDTTRMRSISDLFLRFEQDRAHAKDVDAREKIAEQFRSTTFSMLQEAERKDLLESMFAAKIRRYGILAVAKSNEKPPLELADVFQAESIRQMKEVAPKVAKEIRDSVNGLATAFFRGISREKFELLVDLDFPIPIEIVLTNHNKQ